MRLSSTCLTALFGIQQQPSDLASSLSTGPQHLFPLLCRNFLYLARSWAQLGHRSICIGLKESIFFDVIFLLNFCHCSVVIKTISESINELGRTAKPFSGHLNVMLLLSCYSQCVARIANYLPCGPQVKKKGKVNRYLSLTFNCSDM